MSNKEKAIYITIAILLVGILGYLFVPIKQYSATQTFDYGYAEKTFENPAVAPKPAVYETVAGDSYSIPIGTSTVGADVDIPNGTYDVTCPSGGGNVASWNRMGDLKMNEIMDQYSDEYRITTYSNYKLKQGDSFESDCNLLLTGESTEKLISPAVVAKPAETMTETVTIVDEEIICTSNEIQVECDRLEKFDELKNEAETMTSTITESITFESKSSTPDLDAEDLTCTSNNNIVVCSDLIKYDQLEKDLLD